jgi:hypothetical protein
MVNGGGGNVGTGALLVGSGGRVRGTPGVFVAVTVAITVAVASEGAPVVSVAVTGIDVGLTALRELPETTMMTTITAITAITTTTAAVMSELEFLDMILFHLCAT